MSETWWKSPDELSVEQRDLIDLPPDKSYLIMGPPGSGKTNLALLRANYLYLAGEENLVVVVFTRTLHNFIISGGSQYDFPDHFVKTSTKFFKDLLHEYGVTPDLSGDFETMRRALISEVEEVIHDQALTNIFDTIIVDEAQDYLPEEIGILAELGTQIYAVADRQQKIYTTADPLNEITSRVDETHVLLHHFRNGIKICQLADAIGAGGGGQYDPMVSTSNYDESARPSSVSSTQLSSLDDQCKAIEEKLRLQLRTYPDELLGILAPLRSDVEAIWEYFAETDLAPLFAVQVGQDYPSFSAGARICLCTIHAAKGLEFRTVHLANAENLAKMDQSRNIAFTAVTRAKTTLDIYHCDRLPPFLAGGIRQLNPVLSPPTVDQVFGKRR